MGKLAHGLGDRAAGVPGLEPAIGPRARIGRVRWVGIGLLATAAQPVVAKIERDAVHPGVEASRTRAPGGGVTPDAQEDLLGDVLRFDRVAEHAPGEREDASELRRNEGVGRSALAASDARDQRLVRIGAQAPAPPDAGTNTSNARTAAARTARSRARNEA